MGSSNSSLSDVQESNKKAIVPVDDDDEKEEIQAGQAYIAQLNDTVKKLRSMNKSKTSAKLQVFADVGKNQKSIWSSFEDSIRQVIEFSEKLSEWIKGDILEYVPDERIKSTCNLLDGYFTLLQQSMIQLTKVKTDATYCVEYVKLFIQLCEKLRKEKHLDDDEKQEMQTCNEKLQNWFANSGVIESLSASWTDYRERVGKEKAEWTIIIKNLKFKKAWKYAKYALYGIGTLALTACAVICIVLLCTPAAPAVGAGALVVATAAETGLGVSTVLSIIGISCGAAAVIGYSTGYVASKRYAMVCEAQKTATEIKELVEDLYNDSLKIDNFINELQEEFEIQASAKNNLNLQSGLHMVDPVQITALKNIKSNMENFIDHCDRIKQVIEKAKQKYIKMNANT